MNMILIKAIIITCLAQHQILADPISEITKLGKQLIPGSPSVERPIFTSNVESKREMLANYQQKKAELEAENVALQPLVASSLEEIQNQIRITEDLQRKDDANDLIQQKIAILNETHQALKEHLLLAEQCIHLTEQIIKKVSEYVNDPDFKKVTDPLLGNKKVSTFEDLQMVYQKIFEKDTLIDSLNEQQSNTITELENRKRSAQATHEHYLKKQREQNEFKISHPDQSSSLPDELWSLTERLFQEKQHVDQLKFMEIELKLELIKLKIFINKSQRDILRDLFKTIKTSVQVTESDVLLLKEEFEKKKLKAYQAKRAFDYAIERINTELKEHKIELDTLSKRFNIPIDTDLDTWSFEPKQTINSFMGIAEVGEKNSAVLLDARRKDQLKCEIDLIDEKTRQAEIVLHIKDTFHKVKLSKFASQALNQELKNYDLLRAGIKANISLYQERKNAMNDLHALQKKALENVKTLKENLVANKDTLFRDQLNAYTNCVNKVNEAITKVNRQLDLFGKINGIYSDIITVLQSTEKQVDFIVSELNSITMWYRPQYAISWEGLKRIAPDLELFSTDIVNHFTSLSANDVIKNATAFPTKTAAVWALGIILMLLGLLYALYQLLPSLLLQLRSIIQAYSSIRTILLFFEAILRFLSNHFIGCAAWLLTLMLFKTGIITDPYLYSLFFLASIPYWLYIAHACINFIGDYNREHNYIFIHRDFEFHFTILASAVIYSSIILIFFKKAFLLGNYRRSELPTLLVAINSIILQIALICLISKDQIISLLPSYGLWNKTIELINRYYYLMLLGLIAIIIMINPYIGFGKLIVYVIKRTIYSLITIAAIIWLHQLLKQLSAYFFFSEEDEISSERFEHAKSWYGFTLILLFLAFLFIGAIMLAKIWRWPEQLAAISHIYDIISWLQYPFTNVDQMPVSVWTLIKLVVFVLGGIGISFAFNRIVMGKIFDILLIETGIQNTISSITYYVCFVLAVIIGFNVVGLTSLLVWLLALVVGIGWIIKDPVSDFVSYFIILVQRPIKVGDLIKLEDEAMPGVVRRITPRSVLLRRRNSTTVIIPNSTVINKSITNWNYTRDFIAFDDIIITISYQSDALQAQKIFLQVLAENSYILRNPRPVIRLDNFSENGYVFTIRGFLSSNYTLDQWDIASDIRLAIVKSLQQADITIAVPVRVITSEGSSLHKNREINL